MECKYCGTELNVNSSVCPKCKKDNLKDDLKGLKIAALSLVCVVMLVLLVGLVNYGVTGKFLPDWLSGGNSTSSNAITIITTDGEKKINPSDLDKYMKKTAVTMGKHKLTNGELQIYYWMIAYSVKDLDLTVSLQKQVYDEATGETYHEYCIREGINAWREMTLMVEAGEKAGYVLDADTQAYLDGIEEELESYVLMYQYYGYSIQTVDQLIQSMYGPASNFENYYKYVASTCYAGMYWSDMMEGFEVTDEQINNYFNENEESLKTDYSVPITKETGNLSDIRNIMISVITKKDENGATVEDWEATQAKAQEVYDKWMASDKTEAAFIALVKEYSGDETTNKKEGLYTDLLKGSLQELDIRHILIEPADDKEASWTEAEKEAQRILDLWLTNPTEEYFGELANEHSDDNSGKVTNGGIYTDVFVGQMVKEFEDWCFDDRQPGDYGIVKTQYGYHVMYFIRTDDAADNWVNDESRQTGDVGMVQGDDGYHILFYVGAEPAWVRYCRYGAQSVVADEVLEQLMEANPHKVHENALAIAY